MLRTLGAGAAGTVYLAHDSARGQDVALKVVRRAHGEQIARFRHEFSILSTLPHPNLARAYDFGRADAGWYFTAEVVDGRPMDEWLRGRDTDTAVRTAIGVLCALDHLHRQGLAHGDASGRNILCSESGVKLVDLGLSKGGSAREDLRAFGAALRKACGPHPAAERRVTALVERLISDVPGRAFPDAATALASLGAEPPAAPVYVGRGEELRRVRRSEVAFVHGEEGCGKSAFVERLRIAAQLDGAVVGVGRAGGPPLGAIAEAVAQMAPAGARLAGPGGGIALRAAVTETLVAAARRHSIVLILEDVHALDEDSFGLAVHLARALRLAPGAKTQVVLTWRDAEIAAGTRAAELAAVPAEDVRLEPLDAAAVGAARLGGVVATELAADLRRATDGNAMLLDAVLSNASAFVRREGAWHAARPLEVRVRAGFDELEGEARRMAVLFAATPGPLSRRTLKRLCAEPQMDDALAHLLRGGWVRPLGTDRWMIASALRRRAVPDEEKTRVHAALGGALESHGGKPDIERLGAMAHHFAAAGDAGRARQWGLRYAASCERRRAHAEAAETYERCGEWERARLAWQAAANYPRAVELARRELERERTGETLHRMAEALQARGDVPEALRAYGEAAAAHGDPVRRVEALAEVALLHAVRRETKEMRAALEQAEGVMMAGLPPRVEAKRLMAGAALAMLERDVDTGVPLLDRAIKVARKDGDPRLVWRAWHCGVHLRAYPNPRYFETERFMRGAIRVADRAGYRLEQSLSGQVLALLRELRGELHASRRTKQEVMNLALSAGQWLHLGNAALNLAAVNLDIGDGRPAAEVARLAIQVARQMGDANVESRASALCAMAHALCGEFPSASALHRQARSHPATG